MVVNILFFLFVVNLGSRKTVMYFLAAYHITPITANIILK